MEKCLVRIKVPSFSQVTVDFEVLLRNAKAQMKHDRVQIFFQYLSFLTRYSRYESGQF